MHTRVVDVPGARSPHFSKWMKVDDENNSVTFQMQDGPVRKYGVNGCQVDDLLRFAAEYLDYNFKGFRMLEIKKARDGIAQSLSHIAESRRQTGDDEMYMSVKKREQSIKDNPIVPGKSNAVLVEEESDAVVSAQDVHD